MFTNKSAPTDLINLCLAFYKQKLELSNPQSPKNNQLDALRRMADKFCYNEETFIAYKI